MVISILQYYINVYPRFGVIFYWISQFVEILLFFKNQER